MHGRKRGEGGWMVEGSANVRWSINILITRPMGWKPQSITEGGRAESNKLKMAKREGEGVRTNVMRKGGSGHEG
jgi:hypothetical protein